jgi:hypothetical protein
LTGSAPISETVGAAVQNQILQTIKLELGSEDVARIKAGIADLSGVAAACPTVFNPVNLTAYRFGWDNQDNASAYGAIVYALYIAGSEDHDTASIDKATFINTLELLGGDIPTILAKNILG